MPPAAPTSAGLVTRHTDRSGRLADVPHSPAKAPPEKADKFEDDS